MKAKRDSEIQNTLDYLLSGDVTRKQAAKRLQQLCEDYCDSQIKLVNGVGTSEDKCTLHGVSVSCFGEDAEDSYQKLFGFPPPNHITDEDTFFSAIKYGINLCKDEIEDKAEAMYGKVCARWQT